MNEWEGSALSVNGVDWGLRDVLKQAVLEGGFRAVEDSMRRAVILQFAEKHKIMIEDQERASKVNELRQQLGLYSVAETNQWLSQRGLSVRDLYETAKAQLLEEKVKRMVTDAGIESYFLEKRLDLDRANVSQLVTSTREQAQELLFQCEEGESFFRLAQLYSLDSDSRYAGGYIGWVSRSDLSSEEESFVFGAEAEQTAGPFPTGGCYRLLHVWERQAAQLDEEVRRQLADARFAEWLDETMRSSAIEVGLWRYLAGEDQG
jgi:parvulin-like peptidyl-prolyl isomerase